MAAPKHLRFIVLIFLLAIPMTVCGVLAWFVWSQTWAQQVAAQVSEEVPGTVSFGTLKIASSESYVLTDAVYVDRGLSCSAAQVRAAGFLLSAQQNDISSQSWTCVLGDDALPALIDVAYALAQRPLTIVFTSGMWEAMHVEVAVDGQRNHLGVKMHGVCTADQAQVFQALLPAGVHAFLGDTCTVEACAVELTRDGDAWQWHGSVSARWQHTNISFTWTADATAITQRSVSTFSDSRMPGCVVRERILYVDGHKWWTDVCIEYAHGGWRIVGLDAQHVQRSLLCLFEDEGKTVSCHLENVQDVNMAEYVAAYVDIESGREVLALPDFISSYQIHSVNMSGTVLHWQRTAPAMATLSADIQMQWGQNTLRGQWQSTTAHMLRDATFTSPLCDVTGTWTWAPATLQCTATQLTVKQLQPWAQLSTLAPMHLTMTDTALRVDVADASATRIEVRAPEEWTLTAKTLPVSDVRNLCALPWMRTGTFENLHLQRTAAVVAVRAYGRGCTLELATAKELSAPQSALVWQPMDAWFEYHADAEQQRLDIDGQYVSYVLMASDASTTVSCLPYFSPSLFPSTFLFSPSPVYLHVPLLKE